MTIQIGYPGVEGSFSHIACKELYPGRVLVPYTEFHQVVNAVSNGEVEYGVIPIENSYAGRVAEIHNLLPEIDLRVVAEKIVPISHQLCVLDSAVSLGDVEVVTSHEQAILQCTKSLASLLPNVVRKFEVNTAVAAQNLRVSGSRVEACICSELAAEKWGLCVLRSDIQDNKSNCTTFISLARHDSPLLKGFDEVLATSPGDNICSLIFWANNIPGSIHYCLGGFAKFKINLIKIESYIDFHAKAAKFFLSFIESRDAEENKNALEVLAQCTDRVKILGRYKEDPIRGEFR